MYLFFQIFVWLILSMLAIFISNILVNNINSKVNIIKLSNKQWILSIVLFMTSIILMVYSYRQNIIFEYRWLQLYFIWVMIIMAAVFDIQLKIIPNPISLFIVLSKFVFLIIEKAEWKTIIIDLAIAIICTFVLILLSKITHHGLGMGDVKLIAAIGFAGGINILWSVLLLSLFACALVTIVLLMTKIKTMKDTLPFAPFIAIGYMMTIILSTY